MGSKYRLEDYPTPSTSKGEITAEDLVYSRTREKIQAKLQQIFGKYEDLQRMDDGKIPSTVEREVSWYYMANIERAAVDRDLPETKELLRRAYEEIAKGHKKAKRTQGKTLRSGRLPN